MDLGDDGEEDVCRVCRLEADEENPMVHPCRCSGSVRWVHPDCLKSWLAMSGKKNCEICGHKYTFTKVYPENLPSVIPPEVYGRQAVVYLQRAIGYTARCVLVVTVWLVILPNINYSVLTSSDILFGLLMRVLPGPPALDKMPELREDKRWKVKITNPFSLRFIRSFFGSIRWSASTTSKAVMYTLSGPTSFTEACQDLWAWLGDEWNEWLNGENNLMSSPSHIFRAQILSLLLIGLIISLIFIREWYTTFAWPTNKPKSVETVVDPDEWLVVDGVPRRAFERVPATRAANKYRFAPKWLTNAPINEDAGGLRIRTDVGGRRYRRALAVLATHHGYDVLPGGIVRAIDPAASSKETLDNAATPGIPQGRITDPSLLPTSRTPSSDPLRRRSEGDTRGVLVRFPSAPHLHPEEAPTLARSNSSPSNQSPTDTTSQAMQVQMAQAHAKGLGKAKVKANGAQPLGKLKPPRLTRTYSELQKSPLPRDEEVRAEEKSGARDGIEQSDATEVEKETDAPAQAGPGPSTIAMARDELATSATSAVESAFSPPREEASPTTSTAPVDHPPPQPSTSTAVRPLFSQPAQMPYGTSPTHLSRSDTERRRAPELLLGMSKGKGKARAAEPEVAKESGQIVRAQSTSAGSPTSRARFPAGSASMGSSSSKSAGSGIGGGDEEAEGEAGWVQRRRVSSTASKGTASTSSLGKAAAAAMKEQGEQAATPSPTPMSAGLRRSARLGSKEREKSTSEDSLAEEGGDKVTPVLGSEDKATPLNRSPIPVEWVQASTDLRTDATQDSTGKTDEVEASKTHTTSSEPVATIDVATAMHEVDLAASKAAGQPSSTDDVPAAESHLLDVPTVSDGSGIKPAGEVPSPNGARTGMDTPIPASRQSGVKTPLRVIEPETDYNRLWEQLDKIDGEAAAPATPPADGAAAPGGNANGNANPHVMRAQLGGVGVEIQFEQRPGPQRPAVDRVGRQADLDLDGPDGQMDAVQAHAAGEAEWEDIPDDAPWDDEDEGGWVGEDWDQIFELLGFEGDISGLFQNFLLAIAVMTAVLFFFVLCPMMLGRMMLNLDLAEIVWGTVTGLGMIGWLLLKLAVHATRPLVVFALWAIQTIGGPVVKPALRLAHYLGMGAVRDIVMGKIQSIDTVRDIQEVVYRVAQNAGREASAADHDGTGRIAQMYNLITSGQLVVYAVEYLDTFDHPHIKFALNVLANMGKWTREAHREWRIGGLLIARSYKLKDAVICLIIGYYVLAWVVLVLNLVRVGGPAHHATLKRMCMFIKLSCFIIIELIVFPLTIGAYINIAAMPIFPDMSFRSRINDLRGDGAFGTVFVLWMIGTMFMYGFAQVISWIRSICRVGTLYFIRDPHDPNYSAVKDMIERPTYSQLQKMSASTLMYGSVVGMLFGSTTWTLHYTTNIFPLRLKGFIPFDYLFLLIVVPPTIDSLRPRHTLKWLLMQYWRFSTKVFRLRALLIGRRYTLQRHSTHTGRLERITWALLDIPHQWFFGKYDPAETLMRVPSADSVVLLTSNMKRQPMFIPLNEDKTPKTREAKIRMLRQDVLAKRATPKRDPVKDYTIVRLPQYWRTRVHVFIFATLAASAVFVAMLVVLPILVGRRITSAWVGDVHDGYSYIAGSYAMYVGTLLGLKLRSFIRAFTHAPHFYLTNPSAGARIKRAVFRLYAAAFSIITLFLVHPITRGLVWEMRLGMLVRHGLTEGRNVLHLWDMWSIGAVLNVLESGMCQLFPESRAHAERDHEMHGLQYDPLGSKLYDICRVAWTAIALLLGKSAGSYLATSAIVAAFKVESTETRTMIFRLSGLLVWAITESIEKRKMLGHYLMHVRQDMIDAEYVVEERVENYIEPPKEVKKKSKKGDKKRRGLLPGAGHGGGEEPDLHVDVLADAVAAEVEQVVARGGDLADPELVQRLDEDVLPRLLGRAMQRAETESGSEDGSGGDEQDESDDEGTGGEGIVRAGKDRAAPLDLDARATIDMADEDAGVVGRTGPLDIWEDED